MSTKKDDVVAEQRTVEKRSGVGDKSSSLVSHPWWQNATATAAAIVLGLGVLWALRLIAWPLALLIGGLAIATALEPVVNRLSNFLPRAAAVLFIYLLLILIFVGLGWFAIPPMVQQGQQAIQDLPQMIEQGQQRLGQWIALDSSALANLATSGMQGLSSTLVSLPQRMLRVVFAFLVIIFISVYLLILAPAATAFIHSLVPENSESKLKSVLSKMAGAMGGYVRGVFIDSVLVGILTYIGLLIIGVEYTLVLAVISGVLEIIPVVGPLIAGTIMVSVTFLQTPGKALIVLIFAIILQQLETSVIVPNIMRGQAKISPVLTILALIGGERIGGIIGALIAIPLAAALKVFLIEVIAPAIRGWTGAEGQAGTANAEAKG